MSAPPVAHELERAASGAQAEQRIRRAAIEHGRAAAARPAGRSDTARTRREPADAIATGRVAASVGGSRVIKRDVDVASPSARTRS